MTTDLCAQARDLLPAYSIGATTDEETRLVEAQMTECVDLAQELQDYHLLSDELLRDVPQLIPPPRLLESLMAATAPQAAAPVRIVPQVESDENASQLPRRKPHPSNGITIRPAYLSAIAAAIVIAFVGINLYWITQLNQARDSRAALYQQYRQLEDELHTQTISFDTMRAPDTRWVRMASPLDETGTIPESSEPYAWMIWSATRQEGVLMAQNFPSLDTQQVYQLWGHRGDADTSLATFRPDDAGQMLVLVNEPAWNFERFWITAEPEGGSNTPTGDPFVRVRMDQ